TLGGGCTGTDCHDCTGGGDASDGIGTGVTAVSGTSRDDGAVTSGDAACAVSVLGGKRASASPNGSADGQRAARSRARPRSTTAASCGSTLGSTVRSGVESSVHTRSTSSSKLGASCGKWPDSIW